jgi:hypothetical protein
VTLPYLTVRARAWRRGGSTLGGGEPAVTVVGVVISLFPLRCWYDHRIVTDILVPCQSISLHH